jgi:hypothetical protein
MFALVENGSITKFFKGNKGVSIGDTQYPKQIFQWSNEELQAIGIYPVRIDGSNKKDENYYINTNIDYTIQDNEVVGSYGTATAKLLEDRNATDEDGVELDPVVVIKGLKTIKKEMIDQQCAGLLAPSDWRVIKAKETATTMDSGWKTWRASVRTKCNSMQDQIDGATNVDELKALFEYTNTGTEANPVYTRPLGEFPEK